MKEKTTNFSVRWQERLYNIEVGKDSMTIEREDNNAAPAAERISSYGNSIYTGRILDLDKLVAVIGKYESEVAIIAARKDISNENAAR